MPTTGASGYDTVPGTSAPGASLTDFSLYVEFVPSASWWTAFNAHGDAGRIRVTESTGATEYARDVLVAPTASKAYLRVKWAGAQSGTPTLRVYPDATGSYVVSDTYGGYAAYDSSWYGYWPLEEDPTGGSGAIKDRTTNARHGTASNMEAGDLGAAKVGNGLTFDGVDEYVDLGAGPTIASAGTLYMSAWILQDFSAFPLSSRTASGTAGYEFLAGAGSVAGLMQARVGTPSTNTADATGLDDAAYHLSVLRLTGSNLELYVDGSIVGSPVAFSSGITPSQNLRIASRATGYFPGGVDDVQVHTSSRSSTWIAYEYTITNGSFWSNSGWTAVGGATATYSGRGIGRGIARGIMR